ncbi:GDYXXLXY domain-containing protein [Halobacillus litoralis]|uniref:GDYXXLXY domain-containing protein n=1 Tax=Halobacillus litoralis TaxID=45668 RepID=UPI001CFD7620|nr:GDYXXLXY domain-containing protein [Halobacillus litoralis]
MKKNKWFYGFVLLQVFFLILMSVSYYAMDIFGETITLKTVPVDPRDPFYGDYITLEYEIEQIPKEKWAVEKPLTRGEKVFLLLEKSESEVYELVRASTIWPDASNAQVVLSSKYRWSDSSTAQYQVDIGLDRFYIEENSGALWEQRKERVAEIVLAPWKQKKIVTVK